MKIWPSKLFSLFIKKQHLFLYVIGLTLLYLNCEKGFASVYSVQLSYGVGKPDQLKGYRMALQRSWPWLGFPDAPINLIGLWDISLAHWQVSPLQTSQPHSISIVAFSPLLRLQKQEPGYLGIKPYLEIGIGPSFLSNHHLGHRDLGGQFAFQDLVGVGLSRGKIKTWSLSYHYLHYSNASLLPPNQGIDIKHLLSLSYEFN